MLGLVKFGVGVEALCPCILLASVTVGVADCWSGGGVVQGDSVWFFVVDLEVEVASSDGDGSCCWVVVGELCVLSEEGGASIISCSVKFVYVHVAYIHISHLEV